MNVSVLRSSFLSVLIGLTLTACSGGESGTGFGGSNPKVSVGVITGFGSVYVNGIKYDTSSAEININDIQATEQDLSIGMVVAVVGSSNGPEEGVGKADAVYYESEVSGIVSQNNQTDTLDIMGQMVKYDGETVFKSDDDTVTVIEDVPEGAVLDVSGYRTGDNTLHATHVALVSKTYTTGAALTVKGVVTTGLSNGKFSLGSLTIAVDGSTMFINIPDQQLNAGMVIKVKSMRGVINNELQADMIHLARNAYAATGSIVNIEGIVMSLDSQNNDFLLNGYTVYFSSQTEFVGGTAIDLAAGVKAEVEGVLISDNQIEASAISFRKIARLELIAPVTSIGIASKQVDVSGVLVQLTNKTLLKDDDNSTRVRRFSLADLSEGDKVKIKAYQDNLSMQIVATQFRRVEAQSTDPAFQLTGILDQLTASQAIISGIPIDIAQITPPAPTDQEVGTEVTVVGTAPLTTTE